MKETKGTVIVHSHNVSLDEDYTKWIYDIKKRFRSAQIKTAIKVNSEQLLFNWQLGRDLVVRRAEEKWGNGIVEQVSLDLQDEFPNTKGFSTTNLWNMKKWYLFYSNDSEKVQQLVGEFENSNSFNTVKLNQLGAEIKEAEKLHQVGGLLSFPSLFAYVPWGHHVEIITKCKSIEEAFDMLFYHTKLHCYIVVELKAVPFEPEFVGKLNFYVNAVDNLIKDVVDNPTIGLLICKSKNSTEVKWAFQGIDTPMGVASYDNIKIKEIEKQLPTTEQIYIWELKTACRGGMLCEVPYYFWRKQYGFQKQKI